MSQDIMVSFCISSYKRKEMVEELVLHFLSSKNEKIEVVVVDDCSKDGTIECLNLIRDKRLHVYEKEYQEGGSACWYDALEKGSGRWLFQIIDRDWIDITKIDTLINELQKLEEENVGFAVAGEKFSDSEEVKIYGAGFETLREFALRHSHPTGQIFRKEDWDKIDNKKQYFYDEKYGIYPHGYLYAIMGNYKKGAYLLFDICDKAHYNQRIIKTISTVYASRSDKKEWFMPESRYRLLTLAAENIQLIDNKDFIKPIMLDRYIKFFYLVTNEWYHNCNNKILKKRYHREDMETNYISLLVNGFDYIALFREYLEENKYEWADEDFYRTLCELDQKLIKWLLEWTEGIRKKGNDL